MTAARDHIRQAENLLNFEDAGGQPSAYLAGIHYLAAIACTLADMADQEADTKPQPRAYIPYTASSPTVRDVDLASPADGKNPE